jgi:hypothetical protein
MSFVNDLNLDEYLEQNGMESATGAESTDTLLARTLSVDSVQGFLERMKVRYPFLEWNKDAIHGRRIKRSRAELALAATLRKSKQLQRDIDQLTEMKKFDDIALALMDEVKSADLEGKTKNITEFQSKYKRRRIEMEKEYTDVEGESCSSPDSSVGSLNENVEGMRMHSPTEVD